MKGLVSWSLIFLSRLQKFGDFNYVNEDWLRFF